MQCVVNKNLMQPLPVAREGGRRDDQYVVRFKAGERQIVERAAKKARRVLADWVRIALLDRAKADATGEAPPAPEIGADEVPILQAFRELESDPPLREAVLALCCAVADEPRSWCTPASVHDAWILLGAYRLAYGS